MLKQKIFLSVRLGWQQAHQSTRNEYFLCILCCYFITLVRLSYAFLVSIVGIFRSLISRMLQCCSKKEKTDAITRSIHRLLIWLRVWYTQANSRCRMNPCRNYIWRASNVCATMNCAFVCKKKQRSVQRFPSILNQSHFLFSLNAQAQKKHNLFCCQTAKRWISN